MVLQMVERSFKILMESIGGSLGIAFLNNCRQPKAVFE
jgi:hypothetical protein